MNYEEINTEQDQKNVTMPLCKINMYIMNSKSMTERVQQEWKGTEQPSKDDFTSEWPF